MFISYLLLPIGVRGGQLLHVLNLPVKSNDILTMTIWLLYCSHIEVSGIQPISMSVDSGYVKVYVRCIVFHMCYGVRRRRCIV